MTHQTITLAQAPADFALYVSDVRVLTTADENTVIWPCKRCWSENGHISHYSHIFDGVCFECNGGGGQRMDRKVAQAKADKLIKGRMTRAKAAEKKRLAKLAARDDAQKALVAAHPALAVLLTDQAYARTEHGAPIQPMGKFIYSVAEQFRNEGFLTGGQISAVERVVNDQALRAIASKNSAPVTPATAGRQTFTGKIVKAVMKDNDYGYGFSVKVTIETDAGWKAWGTLPAHLDGDASMDDHKGRTVTITATVEPKEGDPTFAFFKRPAKSSCWA